MNRQLLITALLMLTIGFGAGYWLAPRQAEPRSSSEAATPEVRKPLFYRNPMNPSATSPVPAKDSMGMDYVPVYADEAQTEQTPPGTVSIDPVTVQNIGVRTAKAERRILNRTVRAVGRVGYDEDTLARLHPKIEGWVDKLYVDETGEWVKKNERLLSIYSPQLVSSQQEYLLALDNLKALEHSPIKDIRSGAQTLVKSSRERLQLLDVPAHQLRDLKNSHLIKKNLHIHSPFEGIIVNIGAREGAYVMPQTEIYMIADLAKVWVYVYIYEYEIPWVKLGDEATMTLAGLPGQTFKGRITFIYPYLERKTRTLKVRLEFDNQNLALKPDMFANVTIQASRHIDTVVVPEEAVVGFGIRNRVFVVRAPGKFEPRVVKVGVRAEGFAQILEGVKDGEEVVTSSEFLIDSESKLREAAAKMMEPREDREKSAEPQTPSQGDHP